MATPYSYKGDSMGVEPVVKGEMLKLYLYDFDSMHEGYKWFSTDRPIKYPDEEITAGHALLLVQAALRRDTEVRICNGLDWLVFHADRGEILYPKPTSVQPASMQLEEFWKTV